MNKKLLGKAILSTFLHFIAVALAGATGAVYMYFLVQHTDLVVGFTLLILMAAHIISYA